jgi:long-chain acyl-CoA synthetase
MHWTPDAMGDINPCVEIKLVDYPEAGYFSSNNPPQGEICIRGEPVMTGYYEDDKETAEVLSKDGWIKTGDIGEWTSSGQLKMIDRKKNLVKTQLGEYIALEKVPRPEIIKNIHLTNCVA